MSYWENLLKRQGDDLGKEYTEADFETSAYRLITEQVLYYEDRSSRVAYHLVDRFENDFANVLEPLGVTVRVNRQLRYACGLPRNGRPGSAPKAITLLALFLRKIYDELTRHGSMNDHGEVVCDEVELESAYRLTAQMDMPTKGELDAMLRTLKRWGLARKLEAADLPSDSAAGEVPFGIVIRPAIVDLLGETAIDRLGRFAEARTPLASGPGNVAEDGDASQTTEAEAC